MSWNPSAARAALRAEHGVLLAANGQARPRRGRRPPPDPANAEPPPQRPRPAPAGPPPVEALQWRAHLVVQGAGVTACLRCGSLANRRDPRRLAGTACRGRIAAWPALPALHLQAGAFDAAIQQGTEAHRAEARSRG